MNQIACDRCGRLNNVDVSECEGCGLRPGSKAQDSSSANKWQSQYGRPKLNGSGVSGARQGYVQKSRAQTIAARLIGESGVALGWLYANAIIASVLFFIFFIIVLFQNVDAAFKWGAFIGLLFTVLSIWVQMAFVAPFYSYMSMRAHQVLDNEQ